jgi:hypothetical protein
MGSENPKPLGKPMRIRQDNIKISQIWYKSNRLASAGSGQGPPADLVNTVLVVGIHKALGIC